MWHCLLFSLQHRASVQPPAHQQRGHRAYRTIHCGIKLHGKELAGEDLWASISALFFWPLCGKSPSNGSAGWSESCALPAINHFCNLLDVFALRRLKMTNGDLAELLHNAGKMSHSICHMFHFPWFGLGFSSSDFGSLCSYYSTDQKFLCTLNINRLMCLEV